MDKKLRFMIGYMSNSIVREVHIHKPEIKIRINPYMDK